MVITMLPAEDGDCFFIEVDGGRILIDAGRNQTGATRLKTFLANLPPRIGPTVDILVCSHIDADHILGMGPLLKDLSFTVGDVWFNGYRHHAEAADQFVPAGRGTNATAALNVANALDLTKDITERGLRWNGAFSQKAVMAEEGGPLPRIPLTATCSIVLLGPPKAEVADFFKQWKREVKRLDIEVTPDLARRSRPTVDAQNLRSLALQRDEPDTAKPNGSSICFVIEQYDRNLKRALFLADAHPDDVAVALERYEPGGKRIAFDAIKAAHHGSAANNTSQLIARLQSKLWLVSSDGSRHGHPDPETLARIALAPDCRKVIAFNYETSFNRDWMKPDIQAAYGFTTKFGDGNSPMIFSLS